MSFHNNPNRRLTLVERLQKLNDSLAGLGRRLRDSVATVVGSAVAEAVRDGVRRLLDQINPTPALKENEPPRRDFPHRGDRFDDDRFDTGGYYREPGGWPREQSSEFADDQAEDGLWSDRYESKPEPPTREPETSNRQVNRLEYAVTTAVAAGTWWMQRNRMRRPVLTMVAVAVAAGIAAFFAGPAAAAGLGVLSAVGGMVLTADALSTAATGLAGLVGG